MLAHSISSMVIQANMGADLTGGSPAAGTFAQIADTGRSALTDVGLMLRLLRAGDAPDAPNPTAADIPALVEGFRRAGLTVEPADVALGSEPLGAAVDLSVYRIVQEALTNCLKHSGGGRARLHVGDGGGVISIEVSSALPELRAHTRAGLRCRPRPGRDAGAGRDVRRHPARRARAGRRVPGPRADPARCQLTSVVIADDEGLVREGLSALLGRRGIQVLGVAADGRAAIAAASALHPDVVLMDIRMPGMDGIEATAAIAGPGDRAY